MKGVFFFYRLKRISTPYTCNNKINLDMSYNKRIETSREIRQWLYLIGALGAAAYTLIPSVKEKVDTWVNQVISRKR